MNFVTLKELKKLVPAVEEGKRPPSLKKILEEGTEVVLRKLMENHAEVVVYKNGYVSYQAHERSTVFPIHDCKHHHYESQGNEQQTIPHDHFEDMEWHIWKMYAVFLSAIRMCLALHRIEFHFHSRGRVIIIYWHSCVGWIIQIIQLSLSRRKRDNTHTPAGWVCCGIRSQCWRTSDFCRTASGKLTV